jgi:hypothetical protein
MRFSTQFVAMTLEMPIRHAPPIISAPNYLYESAIMRKNVEKMHVTNPMLIMERMPPKTNEFLVAIAHKRDDKYSIVIAAR